MPLRAQIYEVQPGDSLSLISKKIFGDYSYVDKIAELNSIANKNLIQPGQQLVIPDSVSSKTSAMATDADVISTTTNTTTVSTWKTTVGKWFPWIVVAGTIGLLAYEANKQKKKNKSAKKAAPVRSKMATA